VVAGGGLGMSHGRANTFAQLAEKIGSDQPILHKWESGKKTPSLQTLKKIARIFNVSLDMLAFDDKDLEFIRDKNLISKVEQFQSLNDQEKEMIINLIGTLADKKSSQK